MQLKKRLKKYLLRFFSKKRKSFSNFLGKRIADLQNLNPVSYQKMLRNERD